jgi:predicted MFS family arabinose efflux permease
MFNLARMVGPALGGWLLPRWGVESCFLINAFSYLAVLLALGAMTGVSESLPRVSQRGWRALMEGIRYVHHHPTLRPLMTLAGAMALFGWPVLALLPAFSARVLGRGDQGYSLMLSSLGCGALTAALLVASLGSMQRRRGFLAFGVLTAATGLLGLSLAANLQAAMLCCGLAGLGLVAFFATSQGVVQLSAGDENRGRVMGIYSIVVSGLVPVGNLIAGPAADRWGEDFTIRLQALAILAAGALIAVWSFGPRRH